MEILMNVADAARCLALLNEADQILLVNGEGLLAAHLSTVIEMLHVMADMTVDHAGC